jgi:hypothetical protein
MVTGICLLLSAAIQGPVNTDFTGNENGLNFADLGTKFVCEYVKVSSGPIRVSLENVAPSNFARTLKCDKYVGARTYGDRTTPVTLIAVADQEMRIGRPLRKLKTNQTYWLALRKPTNGILPLAVHEGMAVNSASDSVAILAAVEVPNRSVGTTPTEESVIKSVFQATLSQDWSEAAETMQFLQRCERTKFVANEPWQTQELPGFLGEVLAAVTDRRRNPIWRVFVSEALLEWRFRGSEQPYLNALIDAAPIVPTQGGIPLREMELVSRSPGIGSIPGYQHVIYDREAIAQAAIATTNEDLRQFLLNFVGEPQPATEVRLARLLVSDNERTLERLCELFDRLHGVENTKLVYVRDGAGRKRWDNKVELVRYWRAYFGV